MHFQKDKCLSLGVELLLMQACFDFEIDYTKQHIVYDDYKKPKFDNCDIHFNLSHSENRAMCVMADYPVGCDVEKISEINMDIAKRFFFEDEYATIEKCESQAEKDNTFYRLWTLKESFMKCTGLGFHLPLNEFAISIENSNIEVQHSINDSKYKFFEYDIHDGYKYAVCIQNPKQIKTNYHDEIRWKHIRFNR